MSDTSENPVQNKVAKKYVDDALTLKRSISDSYSAAQTDAKIAAAIAAALPSVSGLAVFNLSAAVGKSVRIQASSTLCKFLIFFTSGSKYICLLIWSTSSSAYESKVFARDDGGTSWSNSFTWNGSYMQFSSLKLATEVTVIPLKNVSNVNIV